MKTILSDTPRINFVVYSKQRWTPRGRPWPRGHIFKSLALASKLKFSALVSIPTVQVLKNVLSSARGQHDFLIG